MPKEYIYYIINDGFRYSTYLRIICGRKNFPDPADGVKMLYAFLLAGQQDTPFTGTWGCVAVYFIEKTHCTVYFVILCETILWKSQLPCLIY